MFNLLSWLDASPTRDHIAANYDLVRDVKGSRVCVRYDRLGSGTRLLNAAMPNATSRSTIVLRLALGEAKRN